MMYRKTATYIDPAALAQKLRIEADGGSIINFWRMNKVIATLREMRVLTSCLAYTDVFIAVKKNGSNLVEKVYDISGNNRDNYQTILAYKPLYAIDSDASSLNFDGVDDCLCFADSSIIQRKNALTLITKVKILGLSNCITIGALPSGQVLRINRNNLVLPAVDNDWYAAGTTVKAVNQLESLASYIFTFDGSYRRSYTNGIYTEISTPATTGATKALLFGVSFLIGAQDYSGTAYLRGQINNITVFDIALTQSQITVINNIL